MLLSKHAHAHRRARTQDDEKDEIEYFGDSFYLDTETWEWSAGPAIGTAEAGAEAPNRRVGQTMTLVKNTAPEGKGAARSSAVALFGGQAPDDSRRNDMQLLML